MADQLYFLLYRGRSFPTNGDLCSKNKFGVTSRWSRSSARQVFTSFGAASSSSAFLTNRPQTMHPKPQTLNKVTVPNAGEPPQLLMRTRWSLASFSSVVRCLCCLNGSICGFTQPERKRHTMLSRQVLFTCALLTSADISLPSLRAEDYAPGTWYAGSWDPTLYAWSDPIHPRTVAVRFEVIDSDTLLPVEGAFIDLGGTYTEETMGRLQDLSTPGTQTKEFVLSARAGRDGVAVFSLSWQKKYPWTQDRPKVYDKHNPESYTYAETWTRVLDDIEKVNCVSVRHPSYLGRRVKLSFSHLVDFGQNSRSELQEPEVFDRFEKAWRAQISNPAVTFCVLKLGSQFSEHGDKTSNRREFFDRVREKDFGIVYDKPTNLTSLARNTHAGPYFVYLVQLAIDPAPGRLSLAEAQASRERTQARDEPEENSKGIELERLRRLEAERTARREELERIERERIQAEQRAGREEAQKIQREQQTEQAKANRSGVATADYDREKREEVNRAMGMQMGIIGALVAYVDPSTAAYKAGLRQGMIVSSVKFGTDNITPTSAEYFDNIMKNRKSGERIELMIWRKSEGNAIREGYVGAERRGKWYRDSLEFVMP